MGSKEAAAFTQELTVDGSTDGYVGVADLTPIYPGQRVWLTSNPLILGVIRQSAIVTEIQETMGGGLVGLRFTGTIATTSKPAPFPNYGRSDCSAYLVADTAHLSADPQLVRIDDTGTKLVFV